LKLICEEENDDDNIKPPFFDEWKEKRKWKIIFWQFFWSKILYFL